MQTSNGDFPLSMDDLRAVARFAHDCAKPVLALFETANPDDTRPREALEAAQLFVDGAPRTNLQRSTAVAAHRAGSETTSEAAKHAAVAAGDAAGSTYLHPLGKASQLRHILGAAAHAARAAEASRDEDHVVAEYLLDAAAKRATPELRTVLARYPRAPKGRSRVAVLMQKLDGLIRDPAPTSKPTDDEGPFFHGTKADVKPGDLLSPGWRTNYGSGKLANHIYVTALFDGAPLAAALAQGEGPGRVYRVQPLGVLYDDPNVTDKRFPGNPTRSYRTTEPIRVIEEVVGWTPVPAELVTAMRARTAELAELGIEAMD